MTISQGLFLHLTGLKLLNAVVFLLFWVVGITNSINPFYDMDDLTARVTAVASGFLSMSFLGTGQTADVLLPAVFAISLLGFIVCNPNAATIFTGGQGGRSSSDSSWPARPRD